MHAIQETEFFSNEFYVHDLKNKTLYFYHISIKLVDTDTTTFFALRLRARACFAIL